MRERTKRIVYIHTFVALGEHFSSHDQGCQEGYLLQEGLCCVLAQRDTQRILQWLLGALQEGRGLQEATLVLPGAWAIEAMTKGTLHRWFGRNNGMGWVDCRASKRGKLVPCGRKEARSSPATGHRKYPACRPTLAQCKGINPSRKKGHASVKW